jgi:hypothetical protein
MLRRKRGKGKGSASYKIIDPRVGDSQEEKFMQGFLGAGYGNSQL